MGWDVFISYGHQDAAKLSEDLYNDLRAKGYKVWWDAPEIRASEHWDVRIEEGLQYSNVVLAVLTPHSTRNESVCRDEWAYALVAKRVLVPVRGDPEARPTLLTVRRSWIDFTGDYDEAFARLLHFLDDMDEGALLPPAVATASGVEPIDFGWLLARLRQDFTGREWLGREIDAWLRDSKKRAFVITGEPGIGKSAIAAWLADTRDEQVAAVHFCTTEDAPTLDPHRFVASVVGQLCGRVSEYAELIGELDPALRRKSGREAFLHLVVKPAQNLADRAPMLLIVDSLDEASTHDGETIVDVLVDHADKLPDWLRVVMTTRPDPRILQQVEHLECFELDAGREENMEDVRLYAWGRLEAPPLSDRLRDQGADAEAVLGEILRASEGNFLIAKCILTALAEGDLGVGELGGIAPDLHGFYQRMLRRRFPDSGVFDEQCYPMFAALAVAPDPLPMDIIGEVLRLPKRQAKRRVADVGQYLEERDAGLTLFHKSLRDWLLDEERSGDYWCDPDEGHRLLGEACWRQYSAGIESMSPYALKRAYLHLARAGMTDELSAVESDPAVRRRRFQLGLRLVFVSYSHRDVELAQRIELDLDQHGHRVWRDPPLLAVQRGWVDAINEAIAGADTVLFLLSPNSTDKSSWCRHELAYAREKGVQILPVRIGHTMSPDVVADMQWLDMTDWSTSEAHYQEGLRKILAYLEGE